MGALVKCEPITNLIFYPTYSITSVGVEDN